MAIRNKIDSNETSLFYAEEESLGKLPGAPIWYPGEPNSYDDFGGELTLLARNPINASRQRKKGVITDLDAAGGFNQDFTQTNFQNLLQGVMFADIRTKANYTLNANDLSVDASGALPKIVSPSLDFVAAGIIVGEWIFVGGDDGDKFANAGNNGFKRVSAVSAHELTIDLSTSTMVTEAAGTIVSPSPESPSPLSPSPIGGVTIYLGKVLKNELGALIKRRSYTFERQLGAPDTAQPAQVQAEYIQGAVANEFTLNVGVADKINADISFVATNFVQRTSVQGVMGGTRTPLVETDAFNTSSDFAMMRMNIIDPNNENPTALFAFLTELSFTINNNVQPNKAVAVLGAFDVTAGTFEVSASATAYFSTIEAVQAIRRNENVCINAAVVKENAGFVIDLPLVALGDGRLDVSQDDPITLPLSMDAATAIKINPNADYTALWVFFDTLPDLATPNL